MPSGLGARGYGLLALGLVIGAVVGSWLTLSLASGDQRRDVDDLSPFSPKLPSSAVLSPGEALLSLPELQITVDAAGVRAIEAARERALAAGIIETQLGDTVPASVRVGDQSSLAMIRLKGDWTDHVATDKWSLRIELDGDTLLGMSRFSIQAPQTRGFLMEWMIMELARREGILAPRSQFVRVRINDRPSGIYYLEEHFTKEMLESQGRREGPIVRFNEDTLWTTWLQYGRSAGKMTPEPARFAASILDAEVSGFDEAQVSSTAALNERLQSALEKMRDLQRLLAISSPEIASGRAIDRLERLTALEALQGRTIDDLFDPKMVGRWLALYCLVNAEHGTSWIQWRFYHDPVLDRLEPIVFDSGALGGEMGLARLMRTTSTKEFLRSEVCYEEMIRSLRRFSKPEYLRAFFTEIGPDLNRYAQALGEETNASTMGLDLPQIMVDFMTPIATSLQAALNPTDAVQFDCRLVSDGQGVSGDRIEIEAWATTWTPVLLEGFQFSNGRMVSAAATIGDGQDDLRRSPGRVLLPHQGFRVHMRLPADSRLSGLRDIQAIKDSARTGAAINRSVRIKLEAVYRLVGDEESRREKLNLRRGASGDSLSGRPRSPSLEQALVDHRCLGYDWQEARLFLRPGTWQVVGDLVIPSHQVLHASAGTTLLFAKGAVFSTGSALKFAGTVAKPILLAPQERSEGWGGLLVHGAHERSSLNHVQVRSCRGIDRGSWQSPGGVSFYRSPVSILDSRFEDSQAEDSLNVVSSDLLLERVSFVGGASDLFDGDFVTGSIRNCDFEASAGDGIDVSGSNLEIVGCRLDKIGDKAISAGERSSLDVKTCVITGASIAVAAKDSSRVNIVGLEASGLEHFLLAAYIKKPEYGPASITLSGLQHPEAQVMTNLVQTACRVELEGVEQPTGAVDVDDLYRRKILGK